MAEPLSKIIQNTDLGDELKVLLALGQERPNIPDNNPYRISICAIGLSRLFIVITGMAD
jgi:hypothetical protein